MADRIVTGPWSEEEDHLLRQAVALYGENDNWKTIALSIPGRTNKACRKRWLHSLQPNIKKTAWTPDEDRMLIELYDHLGPKWSAIARQIPGRTDDACSKRYREALDPSLKKDEWTPEEDDLLIDTYNRIGGKWGQVGAVLQRSGLGCRNRWRLLERKKIARSSQNASPVQTGYGHELTATSHESSLSISETQYPPYYPPEAYPTYPADEAQPSQHSFREPTPEVFHLPDPNIAPFQFSSSSLSAALSDPPPPPAPLPSVSTLNTPELLVNDVQNDSEGQTSLSPLSNCNAMPDMNDVLMSLDDCQRQQTNRHLEISISQLPHEPSVFNPIRQLSDPIYYSSSPISIPSDISQTLEPINFSVWKPRTMEYDFDSPHSALGEISSTTSTPYFFNSNLSPTASPLPNVPLDLPNTEQPSSNSLLFAPATEVQPQSNGAKRPKKSGHKRPQPTLKVPTPTRLSSTLPLSTDPNVRPYACGHVQCWPNSQTSSLNCFATSGELLEHTKDQHSEEDASDKPYRCALPGCGKSWKSINGLQYHLQISTAHFRDALYSRFSAGQPSTPELGTPPGAENDLDDSEQERRYVCPRPDCLKAYRQPSGLRYHVKKGHPADQPTQLLIVPPALERAIPTKAKKLRVKAPPEPVAI